MLTFGWTEGCLRRQVQLIAYYDVMRVGGCRFSAEYTVVVEVLVDVQKPCLCPGEGLTKFGLCYALEGVIETLVLVDAAAGTNQNPLAGLFSRWPRRM